MTTPRKHAALAAQFMADSDLKCWIRCNEFEAWEPCSEPSWIDSYDYFVGVTPPPRPDTPSRITVFGREMPTPLVYSPGNGETFWYEGADGVCIDIWYGSDFDQMSLRAHRLFSTEEDAQAWFDLNTEMRTGRAK